MELSMRNFFNIGNKLVISVLILGCVTLPGYSQEEYKDPKNKALKEVYSGGPSYEVQHYVQTQSKKSPKNIILMIGDGMGLAHVYSAMTANRGHLFLENFKNIGFSKTWSSSDYITDSAAGGTALSSGVKTYNGAIGIDADKNPVPTIRDLAEKIRSIVGCTGGIVWDATKPDGTPRKLMDVSRLNALGWQPLVDLDTGIRLAYEDFLRR